jgi:hypothetical protein
MKKHSKPNVSVIEVEVENKLMLGYLLLVSQKLIKLERNEVLNEFDKPAILKKDDQ